MEKGVCLICLQVGGKMATFNEDAFWKEFRARLEVSQVRWLPCWVKVVLIGDICVHVYLKCNPSLMDKIIIL